MRNFGGIFSLLAILMSCNSQQKENQETVLPDYYVPKRTTYYETNLSDTNAIRISDTIIYDVTIKNPEPQDDWTASCLKYVDVKAFANVIFQAIYSGRATAYDYYKETPFSIEQVRQFERNPDFRRERIGKVQFIEKWYFDEKNFAMGKKVLGLMLAYEIPDTNGKPKGYKAGLKVLLRNPAVSKFEKQDSLKKK